GGDAAGAAPATESAAEAPAAPATRTAVLVGYGVSTEEGASTRRRHRRGTATPPPPATPTASAPVPPALAPRSTPPVRKLAKSLHLDLRTIPATGRDGLITRADVERAAAGHAPGAPAAPRVAAPAGPTRFAGVELAGWDEGPPEERIPVRGVLRSMAEAMVKSAFTAPQAAAWVQVDATRTVELVATLRERPAFADVRLTPLAVIAMGVCHAARRHPGINSSFDDAAGEVVVRRSIGLGIAAATDRGLIVPNVKGADRLDLVSMARALEALVATARAGTTTPADMLGTTLTITNVGPFGIDGAVPILPPGTAAIVAVGQIAPRPWVVDGAVVVRHVVELALAFDHRMVDGALASTFLRDVGRFLEDPAAALLGG
ncbi:MAG TPA: dihydrolipoamide acetyltransferase family protein, partial [Acidimicrobiales bacterium]|nr:dihydrolipoamide acetyltransferase family protein [Acidimicrobiales bacterium]